MERFKMFISGVVALTLLCFFCAPMVQAQVLNGTTHQLKINGSFAGIEDANNPRIDRGGASDTVPVVLEFDGANADTGGSDYQIYLLSDPAIGNDCNEAKIGELSTYTGENVAILMLKIPDFPEIGQVLYGRFFVTVKPTFGKVSFKSVSGYSEIWDGFSPNPDGISQKAKVKAKEKTLEKLGLQCWVQ